MNKSRKLNAECQKPQQSKKRLNSEEVSVTKEPRLDIGITESPKKSEMKVTSHSTPLGKLDYVFNNEDSPDLDYRYSPILLPCTQEGANEIAWDWQCSSGKSINDKSKNQNAHVETPKRTKCLQKKRNSNSPLLQKPLKRKQVKMENIDNMGKLAAELKALNEKMSNMKQNTELHVPTEYTNKSDDPETQLVVELNTENDDDILLKFHENTDKSKDEKVADNSNMKKCLSYEELFDDSMFEDSMVKCSQEVEAIDNLITNTDAVALSTVNEENELSSVCGKDFSTSINSVEASKNSSTSRTSRTSSKMNSSYLKTYSKNLSKTNSTSSSHISNCKDQVLQKSSINNNIISNTNGSVSGKFELERSRANLFGIPDDSFDDCLTTFLDDDKLLSKSPEYGDLFSDTDYSIQFGKSVKQTTCTSTKNNKESPSNFVQKPLISSNNIKSVKQETAIANSNKSTSRESSNAHNVMENRKFFKTKSLAGASAESSYENRFNGNSVGSSVSSQFPAVKGGSSSQDNNVSSINGLGNITTLNRSAVKEGGSRFIKYKSTGNLYSRTKDSQPSLCTPEEIERKRLEAKMRLEAKRKMQQSSKIINVASEVPVKRPVKR